MYLCLAAMAFPTCGILSVLLRFQILEHLEFWDYGYSFYIVGAEQCKEGDETWTHTSNRENLKSSFHWYCQGVWLLASHESSTPGLLFWLHTSVIWIRPRQPGLLVKLFHNCLCMHSEKRYSPHIHPSRLCTQCWLVESQSWNMTQ
jgi:hypothetical protein